MTRLIIGATEIEIAVLVATLPCRRAKPVFESPVYRAPVHGDEVIIVRSGPGSANASAATAVALDRFCISHVYNVGVCGVYADERALLGTVVVGRAAVFADAGAQTDDAFLPLASLPLPLALADNGKPLFNIIPLTTERIPRTIPRSIFFTVATVSGSLQVAKTIRQRFMPDQKVLACEDMESAAVALVAAKAGVPCTVVRGISNLCGDRDHQDWKLKEAAEAAQTTLLKFF